MNDKYALSFSLNAQSNKTSLNDTRENKLNAWKWDFYFDAFKLIKSSLKKMNKIISSFFAVVQTSFVNLCVKICLKRVVNP